MKQLFFNILLVRFFSLLLVSSIFTLGCSKGGEVKKWNVELKIHLVNESKFTISAKPTEVNGSVVYIPTLAPGESYIHTCYQSVFLPAENQTPAIDDINRIHLNVDFYYSKTSKFDGAINDPSNYEKIIQTSHTQFEYTYQFMDSKFLGCQDEDCEM